jgi:zinc protease
MRLVDAGMFSISARLIPGKKAEDVEAQLFAAVEKLVKEGVTPEELEKAKTAERIATIRSRETCTSIASMLGEEEVFGGDANRVNEELARIEALTVADLQAVAAKYLQPQRATVLHFVPDPTGSMARRQESDAGAAAEAAMKEAPVAVATGEVKPREVTFPEGYPTRPPMSEPASKAVFAKGEATEVNGVQVVVMPDSRIPMVNIAVVMRSGSHSDPPGKEGLASLTASMVRRGTSELPFEKLNEMLESRGIMLEVNEASDHSRVMAGCITDELDTTVDVMKQVVFGAPAFDPVEFEKLKKQTINQIRQSRANPQTAAQLDLQSELWGNSVLGRSPSMESVAAITLDDVKAFHAAHFVPTDALMVISGDVTTEKAQALATRLLEGWTGSAPPKVDYSIMPASSQRRIILIDNPDGKQSVIRMANRAYDNSSEERFAGSLASQILSAGIDSRLGKYVRAEKGYAYGVAGVFRPTRQAGAFEGSTETAFETTADAIRAMFKVFEDMKSAPVTPAELSEAKSRVAGNMVMEMQTIAQQAQRRIDVVLNKYPLDYYDNLPARIAQVTDAQIQDVMNRYVKPEETLIVVVAPAEKVQEQLQSLGKVEVRPMPLKRGTPSTQPSEELLKK